MPYIQAAKAAFPSKEALFAEVNRERDQRKKMARALQYTAVIAMFAAGVWGMNPTLSTEAFVTRYAEHAQFVLPDGSQVHLNANTRLVCRLKLRSREMTLEKGEASFSVYHEWRPFTVAVNTTKVLDIGTVFNISQWQHYFVTTVVQGEVELQTGDHKTRLTSGQSIRVSQQETGLPYPADMEMVTAWQNGKILFNKTPLKEAVASLQRYRQATIQLDPRLENLLITGIYDVSNIEQLLDSMDTMFPVNVTRRDDGVINIQKN